MLRTLFGALLFFLLFTGLVSCEKVEPCVIELSKADPSRQCPLNCTLVCGCNGKEYCNGCEAEKWGIFSYTEGPCRD